MNIQGITPAIFSPVQGQSAISVARAHGSSNSSDGSSSTSATNLEGTFLNLLVTELQNQDPTSPVDPTQMVSQMVSLNQLDQLISINQVLKNMATDSTTPASVQSQAVKAGTTNPSRTTRGPAPQGATAQSVMPASAQSVPYLGNGASGELMNLYSNMSLPGTSPRTTLMGAK